MGGESCDLGGELGLAGGHSTAILGVGRVRCRLRQGRAH